MPYLGDFLGHLLSELTIARAQADAEAIRIAEHYGRDPMLKSFPVPRFRLPTVTLRVPVVVDKMEVAPSGRGARGHLDVKKATEAFWRAFDAQSRSAKVKIPAAARERINADVRRVLAAGNSGLSGSVVRVAHTLTTTAIDALRRGDAAAAKAAEAMAARESELTEAVLAELIRVRTPPPRLNVLVTSSELKEAGDDVMNLDLQVSEDGVEWTTIDGAKMPRLVPE